VSPFAFANLPDLPLDTALLSLSSPANALSEETTTGLDNALLVPEQVPQNPLLHEDVQILWPMMPKETLAKLADSFYPNSPILAQRFVQKSIRLSKALGVAIDPNTPFRHAQIIAIPNEKEVRALTHRIKKMDELAIEDDRQLQLSYQLKQPPHSANQPTSTIDHRVEATTISNPINIHLLDIRVPKIALPTLQPPNLANFGGRLKVVWHNAQTQMHGFWESGMETVLDWNSDLVSLKSRLKTQDASEVLADSTVNYSLMLGVPLLFVLLIWRLQKQYMRRKIALLNTIPTTLEEPELGDVSAMPYLENHPSQDAYYASSPR
jgi:hypothetical protein